MTDGSDHKCPICKAEATVNRVDPNRFLVTCPRCRQFYVSPLLNARLRGQPLPDWNLVAGSIREKNEAGADEPQFLGDIDECQSIAHDAPRTVPERAERFLRVLQRRTEFFGHVLNFALDDDFPLAYAKGADEFAEFFSFLVEKRFAVLDKEPGFTGSTAGKRGIKLTAEGLGELPAHTSAPIVFVTSTCYDLLDLRLELADFLEKRGFIVRLSEDWERFVVDGRKNSVETCLENLRAADAVVCILDRRYGGVMKSGPYRGKSATHAEVDLARQLRKPLLFFIRDRADSDYQQLRRGNHFEPEWVERDPKKRDLWLKFVQHCFELPESGETPNWRDLYTSVVDLKKVVLKRLGDVQRSPSVRFG